MQWACARERSRADPGTRPTCCGSPRCGAGAARGCGRRRGAAGHRSRSVSWAGAALAGSLRRAPLCATKDGQRVGRRPRPRLRPRRPLVPVCVPRRQLGRSEPSGPGPARGANGPRGGRGRAAPSPRAPGRRQWPCGEGLVGRAGAWAPPSCPHLRTRPGRGPGHRPTAARDAREPNPRAGPRGGALSRRERGPGPGASAGYRSKLGPGRSGAVSKRQGAGIPFLRFSPSWWHLGVI